ncbi:MAG: hypothetical protein RIB79_07970 [Allomuricauda sp.]|jgi:hypothetical protein
MVRIYCILISFLVFIQGRKCVANGTSGQEVDTQIRVINNSGHSFTHVSLFSMKFENLQPKDTSEYKSLRYDSLKDDPLIYCVQEGKNLGRYLKIPKNMVRFYTYSIDSISNGILYVSSFEDKKKE